MERHPLPPWLPENARLLICGTFPPPRARWCMEFYYPNFINDMWRVMGLVFHGDKDYFVDVPAKTFRLERIKRMLMEKGIALSDTGAEVVRRMNNASDKYLEIRRPLDLPGLLAELPECEAVVTTGEKAAGVIAELTGSKVPKPGMFHIVTIPDASGRARTLKHWRMPSTSRAYPLPLAEKAAMYAIPLLKKE